jgi:UDP-2,4-diacetamido-2,4,6-trideoxy-beta-L-altropyranose hydrolase
MGFILFRTDSSLEIGIGHVMRCLTLANEIKEQGCEVRFICRNHPGNLNDLIRNKGFQVFELPQPTEPFKETNTESLPRAEYAKWLGVSWQRDASETISLLGDQKPDWLIVDHYALDKSWETALRPKSEKIMVIDDLADREHDCDLLLDQNFYLDGNKRYSHLIPPACQKFIGPEYALLREEFRCVKRNYRKQKCESKRIFVFFGGSDFKNITTRFLEILSVEDFSEYVVDVVIGMKNPHKEIVKNKVLERPNTNLYIQVDNIAELMIHSDLCIGAGGATNLERMYLGLPSLVVTVAANQIESTRDLEKAGFLVSLGCEKNVTKNNILFIQERMLQALKLKIEKKKIMKNKMSEIVEELFKSVI